jgi:hypothetical protein
MDKQFEDAHGFSSRHREKLEHDEVCGCFHCQKIFSPSLIVEWVDDENTAVCPFCGIDSIIGVSSGFPITKNFLMKMHNVWF